MKALTGLLLLVFGHGVSSVLHSMQYFLTGSSGLTTFPEFVAVGMVDGVQIDYYDSNTQRVVLKQDWMELVTIEDPDYLERNTGKAQGAQQTFKANIGIAKLRFNQTGGAHIVQRMYGCEWDDEDDSTDGYNQYGYDGEDFIALDLKTLTWVAPVRQAVPTKQRWDQEKAGLHFDKYFLTEKCVDWLKKQLSYGKSTLQRTERPRVSLLQRSPSSPVVCHATGFYPDRVVMFWRRDGQELHEQVDPGEVLPNHDGTFQVSVDLNLTAVPQEDWGRYECVVQLKGIEDISTPLDTALIRTNSVYKSGITIPIIIGFVVLLLAAAAVVGVLLYKKRNDSDKRHKPVGSDTSSENTEGQNPAPEAQPLTTLNHEEASHVQLPKPGWSGLQFIYNPYKQAWDFS
ncbi:major histocompatibility complex class I-related gene protein [Gadus morhua]|uniref:major histocompatibility complex class I-related gene protein n=1 Tax=Gadus morhua TaxID=8049 RepID=UPI0011B4A979|nr:major histocompatibility complex class I-related gene protein-like [Gadus morhua]